MSSLAPPCGPLYSPRRPETTVLYRVLQAHLETFIERTETGDRELPGFVKDELRSFLACGIFAHGFARFRCASCGHSRLVPFSCRGRGFCPSCTGRRMADQAAYLVDHVIPHVPVRQWVLSLPFDIRALVAFKPALRRLVLREFLRAVYAWIRRQARRQGVRLGHCGSVTFVQRFGSDLRLNVHFHVLALDGVYAEAEDGELLFHPTPAPDEDDLARIARRVRRRVARALEERGFTMASVGEEDGDTDDEILLRLGHASAAGTIAQGPRAGMRIPPAPRLPRGAAGTATIRRDTSAGGFNIHAGVALQADDRPGLERLCRYIARPPIATERLELTPDGNVRYHFRRLWRNGTAYVDYSPLEFIERLVPLVPAPRSHLLVYHGVLAPNAALRPRVVPTPSEPEPPAEQCPECTTEGDDQVEDFPARRRSRLTWAQLLKRVFGIDGLKCPACAGGRLKLISFITEPDTITRILSSVGLPTRAPPIEPARPLDEPELDFA